MFLIFDTETTGLPKKWNAPITDTDNWPRCVQIAWQLHDEFGNLVENKDFLIKPEGFDIPYDAEQIHGISTKLAEQRGTSLKEVLQLFNKTLSKAKFVVGQNIKFDLNIMGCEFFRQKIDTPLLDLKILDTCTERTASLCMLSGGKGGRYKLPTLTELYKHLFGETFSQAHNATADVEATTRCFLELIRLNNYTTEELEISEDYFDEFKAVNPNIIPSIALNHVDLKEESKKLKEAKQSKKATIDSDKSQDKVLRSTSFSHLHNHSQFSILQSTSSVKDLISAAVKEKMPAVAITDSGNMMHAFYLVKEVLAHNKNVFSNNESLDKEEEKLPILKPIVGCEFNVCENHLDKSRKDNGYQVVLLAKNKKGYYNLSKMASIACIDGFYYVPRIDREIIKKYKEDIIVLSGGLNGEISNKILNTGEKQAEEALLWWKETFKEDFYIEIIRHNQENENHVNEVLIKFADKHKVKLIAANNTFYINKEDSRAHDILLCVKDGEKVSTQIGRGRGFRFGLPNNEYYFKSQEEMKSLFTDIPQSIINTQEIVDKIEIYTLARDVLLPKFDIPEQFRDTKDIADKGKRGENNYLRHLTYEGVKERYPNLNKETKERIDFELSVIGNTGYPGYFLIVHDFITEARKIGVSVGPGRGSVAGSAVAYCLGITNIDPIKYDLLFERFLNPDRVSLPDIDIDFDDEGRQKVIDYVIHKYGANQVAQIITYGKMAAKSSVRDTARVLDLPLHDADRIAKLIPNLNLANIFGEDEKSKNKIKELKAEEKLKVNELLNLAEGEDLEAQTLQQARVIEGTLRNTGIHACGVIITPEDITNLIPVTTAKDSDLYVTQYDNSVVESAGLLKMDFLGLKTLSLIKGTCKIIKAKDGTDIVPDDFPLDDEKTYQLFQKGETIGIFQYESAGMRKYLKLLKPTEFADLIAMNALYRPGPIEYIPSFIMRKHGEEEIAYDLPEMEEYLKETYGVTVYQEQVMLLSQKIAGFTKGEADILRKAMGKKIFALLQELKPKFISGGEKNGHPKEILEKIWKNWEAFAAYAFNKSHSTCYAYVAYQTAYLKAHYPAEYMAAVLSNNMKDVKQIAFFMEECKRMKIDVLSPDVNESYHEFAVNKEGKIRFGIGAIKGISSNAVKAIVDERKKNGHYKSIFDLAKRVDLKVASKKAFDGLILAGGFDSFTNTHRAQYFITDEKGITFIEKAIRYGNKYKENKNSAQISLFGEASNIQLEEPTMPDCDEWNVMESLGKEKEVVGMYISGNPLDSFKTELKYFCNASFKFFDKIETFLNRELTFGGILAKAEHRISKSGRGWASFVLEDYSGTHEFRIFGEEYLRFKHFLVPNAFLQVKIFIKPGWKENDVRVQFNNFQMLQDVLEKSTKKISLQLSINEINEEKINFINDLLKMHKGTHPISFVVYDMKEKLKLNMPSRSVKVKVTQELLNELESQQLKYYLN